MVGKVISGSSFSGTVGYVMKEESRILEAEGVMPPEVKDMVQDFKDQTFISFAGNLRVKKPAIYTA